jgi:hypothetical protein
MNDNIHIRIMNTLIFPKKEKREKKVSKISNSIIYITDSYCLSYIFDSILFILQMRNT